MQVPQIPPLRTPPGHTPQAVIQVPVTQQDLRGIQSEIQANKINTNSKFGNVYLWLGAIVSMQVIILLLLAFK